MQTCDKTYQQEIQYLQTQSSHVFRFGNAVETPHLHNARIAENDRRIKTIFFCIFGGFMGLFCGPMIMGAILDSISVMDDYKGTMLYGFLIALPAIVSVVFAVRGLIKGWDNKFTIRIDNSTFNLYELRKTYDGKLYLISYPNFDGQNPMAVDPIRPDVHIPFRMIYELNHIKDIKEDNLGITIKADVLEKVLNLFNPIEAYNYTMLQMYDYTIHIQKGTYPEDMPSVLGCRTENAFQRESTNSFEQPAQQSSGQYVGVQSYSQQPTAGSNGEFANAIISDVDFCKKFSYSKDGIPLMTVCLSCLIVFVITMVAFTFCSIMEVDNVISGIIVAVGCIILLSTAIGTRQLGTMKRLIQYFRDGQGNYFSVQFLKGASIGRGNMTKQNYVAEDLQKAQDVNWGYYYVKRFKEGFVDYNNFSGGEAKVIHYKNLALKRKGLRKSTFTYEDNGRIRTVKISNLYHGLADELAMKG